MVLFVLTILRVLRKASVAFSADQLAIGCFVSVCVQVIVMLVALRAYLKACLYRERNPRRLYSRQLLASPICLWLKQ